MDDLWNQPLSPIATSPPPPPASATPDSNGAQQQEQQEQQPPPIVNALACVVQTPNKGKRKRSPYWAHFNKILKDGLQKAVCKYCSRLIGCDPKSGTSALKNHIDRCKEYPNKSSTSEHLLDQYSPPLLPVSVSTSSGAVPWDKFPAARTVRQMTETMARLTQDPFAYGSITWPSTAFAEANGYRSGRTPWAIKESDTGYNIRFDMPGMTRKDVKVWVEENTLVVEAEKVPRGDPVVDEDEWPTESYGKYRSRVLLPEAVNDEKIKAEVKDGVLQVTIPKARATNQRIEINVQ